MQLQKILDSDIRLTSASITDLQKLRSCLFGAERESTGIYFYEKFTNFPLQLIDKLQQALLDDILWARDPSNRNKENERQLAFFQKLQNIVVILPCSDPSTSNGVDVTGWSSPVFDCFEDEVYFQEASIAILFQPDSNLYRSSKAIVALVPFCQMEQIASKIKGLVNS